MLWLICLNLSSPIKASDSTFAKERRHGGSRINVGPVDCKVEDWSSWSDCSATCGGGTKTRGKGVVQEAENGGAVCSAKEEEPCNTDQCKGIIFYYYLLHFTIASSITSAQLTAWSRIGQTGPSAVSLVMVEPRQEEGELFKRQSLEELSVQL